MNHKNSKKYKRLANFPKESVETSYKTIKGLISFNFKYLDSEQGQRFSELTVEQFSKIIGIIPLYTLNKIIKFSHFFIFFIWFLLT